MKIIFDKDDQMLMNGMRYAKETGKEHPVSFVCDDEEYSINFNVVDSVKANVFLFEFMRTDDAGRKAIEDATGIHVEAISNASDDAKLHQMKELIKEFECKSKKILK